MEQCRRSTAASSLDGAGDGRLNAEGGDRRSLRGAWCGGNAAVMQVATGTRKISCR